MEQYENETLYNVYTSLHVLSGGNLVEAYKQSDVFETVTETVSKTE